MQPTPRVPQISTLVVAEHKAEKLSPATLPAVTAALQLGGPVTLLVAGEAVSAVAQVWWPMSAIRLTGMPRC